MLRSRSAVRAAPQVFLFITWTTAALFLAVPAGRAAGQASRRTNDGVYTEEQAKRGEAAVQDKCVPCHEMNLAGGTMGPALVGDRFVNGWQGKELDVLFEFMRTTMPADNPASLSPETYADILAFILKSNGFPAGTARLSATVDELKQVRLEKD